ncbi:hypothetical protein EDD22DRAFT_851091 [Suillus occidentalis]|nr:hypothetical protein EDD22DRAFT_851091 [Suillus occidentalis]
MHIANNCKYLDIILGPLKPAAQLGIMILDPIGHSHYCFTPFASYIANTPKEMMLACVGGKTSPVTMAIWILYTHALIHKAFFHEVQKFCLDGAEKPFWSDWPLAKPSYFFTPKSLHHIHKQFYDHDAQWIIIAVGESEFDFRFSVLQPTTGYQCHLFSFDNHLHALCCGYTLSSPTTMVDMAHFLLRNSQLIHHLITQIGAGIDEDSSTTMAGNE